MPGLGTSKQSTSASQTQNGTIAPYEPTQGALQGILNGVNSVLPNASGTSAQTSALNALLNNAQTMPNYGGQAAGVANNLLSGGPNYQPIVSDAYGQYQGAVNPILNASLDPTQTPGLSDALATIRNDVTNSVNGMFAGAGRDLSGLNQQALARGISQGEAPVIVSQYNQNVANRLNAANGALGAGQSTAGTLSGLQQTQFGNQLQGLETGINTVPTATNSNINQQLSAANSLYGLPVQNLAQLEALTVPIAGLGRQYEGNTNSQSDTTKTDSPLSMISQGVGIFNSLFSDPDLKADAREVGKLHDGQKVYAYRYKDDPNGTTRIGLMADEVQKKVPEAVGLLGGFRTVNYETATAKAAKKAK